MIEKIFLVVYNGLSLGVQGGWFSTNWERIVESVSTKQYFDILINPFGLIITVALVLLALLMRSKGIWMVLIAIWGYVTVYHFTIESKRAGDVIFDYKNMQVSEIGTLVIFFAGFLIVTIILLYLGFVKGD